MRFYIADCHFYHEALNTKMDKRGFYKQEFKKILTREDLHQQSR